MAKTKADETPSPPPTVLPRMEPRYLWLDVPEYPTYQARCWTNAPQRVMLDLDSGDPVRVTAAIRALVVDTQMVVDVKTFPDWYDSDGACLPKPTDDSFIAVIPTELLAMTVRAIRLDGPAALGNSLALKRRS